MRTTRDSEFDQRVALLQRALVALPILFIGGIITWIAHLIRTAWRLKDVPSASIAISLVAIPVFVVLLSVILYTLVGLLRTRDDR